MPEPTFSDVHVDTLNTQVLIAFLQSLTDFISDQIFPIVTTTKQSGFIGEFTREDFFRDVAEVRAPGTEPTATGFNVKKNKRYTTEEWATGVVIPDEVRFNQDDPFDVDRAASEIMARRLLLRRDIAWAADFMKVGVWGNDLVGGTDFTQLSDFGTSDPIDLIDTGKEKVRAVTSFTPQKLVIGQSTWLKLKNHPQLIEKIKFTQRAQLTVDLVASLLELETLLIGRSIKVTTPKGAAVQTTADVWGKNAFLCWTPGTASLFTPSAGYTFTWQPLGGLAVTRRFRKDRQRSDILDASSNFDQKEVSTELATFFSNVVA